MGFIYRGIVFLEKVAARATGTSDELERSYSIKDFMTYLIVVPVILLIAPTCYILRNVSSAWNKFKKELYSKRYRKD